MPTIGEGRGATAPSSSSLATLPQGGTGADALGTVEVPAPWGDNVPPCSREALDRAIRPWWSGMQLAPDYSANSDDPWPYAGS